VNQLNVDARRLWMRFNPHDPINSVFSRATMFAGQSCGALRGMAEGARADESGFPLDVDLFD
jgi:hypothetical protein